MTITTIEKIYGAIKPAKRVFLVGKSRIETKEANGSIKSFLRTSQVVHWFIFITSTVYLL